jgi:peroxiredoxin
VAVLIGVGALVTSAGGSATSTGGSPAQPFVLPTSDGGFVTLSEVDGPALLYFNEGVGCDVCFEQQAQLERSGALEGLGVTVLPIVTNDAASTTAQLARFGISTPYVLDPTKEISAAYDTLGRGHHADLPGHSFILVDDGKVLWRGDYPSMWVDPDELAAQVREAVA